MRISVATTIGLLLSFAANSYGDDDNGRADELKALVGTWTIDKAELGGVNVLERLKPLDFEIKQGGKYTAKHGDEIDNGSFTIDTSKAPKQMNIKPNGGPNKGKSVKSIYKLEGDTITVCYELAGIERPVSFGTKPNTTLYQAVYTRKK
jgi:uncharacterized protein (TIGR03067 family)